MNIKCAHIACRDGSWVIWNHECFPYQIKQVTKAGFVILVGEEKLRVKPTELTLCSASRVWARWIGRRNAQLESVDKIRGLEADCFIIDDLID